MNRIDTLKSRMKTNLVSLVTKIDEEKNVTFEDKRLWSPAVDKSGAGFAVIRFLPSFDKNTGEKEDSWVKFFRHNYKDGSGRWLNENCPTTIQKDCPICESNSELWRTEIKSKKDIASLRKRKVTYISNIMVLSDPDKPSNEGEVFLFKYGQKIHEKIEQAIKPQFADETPFDPFCPISGADFKLKIREVKGYRNYDMCEFSPNKPLFSDDNALERVLNSVYDLKEFINPLMFKSYDALNTRFKATSGSAIKPPQEAGSAIKPPQEAGSAIKPPQEAGSAIKPPQEAATVDEFEEFAGLFNIERDV